MYDSTLKIKSDFNRETSPFSLLDSGKNFRFRFHKSFLKSRIHSTNDVLYGFNFKRFIHF
ncbi:hypothetical protein APS47_16075 [Leptospira kirschneri serovar Mozdok]|nr:hypothetical protein APS47_16075 [Leptospira kirschneri serovar Mozdok]